MQHQRCLGVVCWPWFPPPTPTAHRSPHHPAFHRPTWCSPREPQAGQPAGPTFSNSQARPDGGAEEDELPRLGDQGGCPAGSAPARHQLHTPASRQHKAAAFSGGSVGRTERPGLPGELGVDPAAASPASVWPRSHPHSPQPTHPLQVIDITWPVAEGKGGLVEALSRIATEAAQAMDDGFDFVVLSDRSAGTRCAPRRRRRQGLQCRGWLAAPDTWYCGAAAVAHPCSAAFSCPATLCLAMTIYA